MTYGETVKQYLRLSPDVCYPVSRSALDYIEQLENAIRDIDSWVGSGEGVTLSYYADEVVDAKAIQFIKTLLGEDH